MGGVRVEGWGGRDVIAGEGKLDSQTELWNLFATTPGTTQVVATTPPLPATLRAGRVDNSVIRNTLHVPASQAFGNATDRPPERAEICTKNINAIIRALRPSVKETSMRPPQDTGISYSLSAQQ